MSLFETLERMVADTAEIIRPSERMTVSEAAEEYRYINNAGSYVGKWLNDTTPYLVEPQDCLTSRLYTGVVFSGPAQCGKTDMYLNWVTHAVMCDPADMMLVQTSQVTARDFSMRRVDRLHRHSEKVGERLIKDNTHDKHYRSGMIQTLSWPSINELSGKPIPRLWLTDYDRMDQDVEGEGSPYDLAKKRATSFKANGMCVAESSPGFMVENPKWMKSTKHEAPPTQGILSLYNRGDRRRWYWRCVECGNPFEPDFNLLNYPDSEDFMEAAEMATLQCPHCHFDYTHEPTNGSPGKYEMNMGGRWVKDGMFWLPDGSMQGTSIRSDTASFWLKGVAAAFSSWKILVFNYLTADKEYRNTGSEEALKTTVNVDQGNAYTPKSMESTRTPEDLKKRARPMGMREVPYGVRFLVATIDVQKNRFVVQIHGMNLSGDIWIVDRYDVKYSKRRDPNKPDQILWVNPAAYPEDWKLLVEEVMLKTYPLADGSGRRMAVKYTFSDSAGREGFTANAYAFYRWLRWGNKDEDGNELDLNEEGVYHWDPYLIQRFMLLKGASNKAAPRVRVEYPDSQRKDRFAEARGEIPILFINTNDVKDMLNNKLDRTVAGGQINFPDWLPDNFFTELTVEIKDPVKGWINPHKYRNESWDLLAYCIAGSLTNVINIEHLSNDAAPDWAEEWDFNSMVFDPEEKERPYEEPKKKRDLSAIAEALG